ncbi:MAG: uracil-DNA glycosylase family protein [Rhodobacterales bacterium]|nr:uracil-DNA glycosylase family protein [Rhodobacterales bacterium]
MPHTPRSVPEPLDALLRDVRACTLCPGLPLGPKPILQADARARVLIAGQAPGHKAHAAGRPFDDVSGDRLRAWLGVDRDTFYDPAAFAIIPMGFCFPGTAEGRNGRKGGDLPPRPECAPAWRARLLDALPRLELTLAIGRYALDWHLPDTARQSVAQVVGNWRNHWPDTLPLPHPSPRNIAWMARHPWFEADVLPALKARVRAIL